MMLLTLVAVFLSTVHFYPEFGILPLMICAVLLGRLMMERNYCCESMGTQV